MISSRPPTCHARPSPDGQMRCTRCGLVWDRGDPEPPECREVAKKRLRQKPEVTESEGGDHD